MFVFNASALDRQEGNDTQFKLEFSATAGQNMKVAIDPVDVKVAVRALPSIALSSCMLAPSSARADRFHAATVAPFAAPA